MTICANTIVSLHFRMWNEEGTLLQDTFSGSPVRYLHGGSVIDRSLQEKLSGIEAGSLSRVEFTNLDCRYVFDIYIQDVREADESEIALGYPVEAGAVCDENCECFNQFK